MYKNGKKKSCHILIVCFKGFGVQNVPHFFYSVHCVLLYKFDTIFSEYMLMTVMKDYMKVSSTTKATKKVTVTHVQLQECSSFISSSVLQAALSALGRAAVHNVCTARLGFHLGLHPQSERESFLVLFDLCVRYTNLEGRRRASTDSSNWIYADHDDMETFFGLHLLAEAMKAHHRNLSELYRGKDGIPPTNTSNPYSNE